MLCLNCARQGYCRKKTINAVSDDDLNDPRFLYGCRIIIGRLLPKRCDLLDHLTDLYRDLKLVIVESDGQESLFDVEIFDFPELRHWIDYTFRRPPPTTRTPFVRKETRLRFKTLVSIFRAAYPHEFENLVAANDNEPTG